MGAGSGEADYDFFISYSHLDRRWVDEDLLPLLRRSGLSVLTDDDFPPGVPAIENMEWATSVSRHTILVMTPAWVESEWCQFEALSARTNDPRGAARRFIPVLVQPCAMPDPLNKYTLLDLTKPGSTTARLETQLLNLRSETLTRHDTEFPGAMTGETWDELVDALGSRQWNAADELTRQVLTAAGTARKKAIGLTIPELRLLRCDVLQAVDRLWLDASGGRFGFSVQRGMRQLAGHDREALGDRLGWRRNGTWIAFADVTFDSSAPPGHLPIGGRLGIVSATHAMTAGRGVGGFLESQAEVARSGVLDLFQRGGWGRFKTRLNAEVTGRSGFALWWIEGRNALLDRLGHCLSE